MERKMSAAEIMAKRGRANVPTRQEHLSDLIGPEPQSKPEAVEVPLGIESDSVISQWKAELESLPPISNFMLRVETDIKEALQTYAKKQGVTPETLVQAMWLLFEQDENMREAALKEARKQHRRRTRAAELKNLVTRAEKNL